MKATQRGHDVRLEDMIGALDEAPMGMSIIDRDLRLTYWNRAFLAILDFPAEIMQQPLMLETLFRYNARRGDYGPGDEDEQVQTRLALTRRFEPHNFIRTRKDGQILSVVGRVLADEAGAPAGFVTLYQDITREKNYETALEQKNAELMQLQHDLLKANNDLRSNESRILELMRTDPLTGAANRRWLAECLLDELERARRSGHSCSVIMADLDHFKGINDRFGHAMGDAVLRGFVGLAKAVVRPYDLVARYGGEEFVLLMPGCNQPEVSVVAQRLREQLAAKPLDGVPERVTASFGIACSNRADTPDQLLLRADTALYAAKHQGRNRVIYLPPDGGVAT